MYTLLQKTCIFSSMISIQQEPHLRPGLPLWWSERQGCNAATADGSVIDDDCGGGCVGL